MSSMINENVLLESSSARNELFSTRTENHSKECLNKAKAVIWATWKATDYGTTEQVAEYYEVGYEAIASLYKDHKEEFAKEVVIVNGSELRELKSLKLFFIKPNTSRLMLWSVRAIVMVGLFLENSKIADRVRLVCNIPKFVSFTKKESNIELLAHKVYGGKRQLRIGKLRTDIMTHDCITEIKRDKITARVVGQLFEYLNDSGLKNGRLIGKSIDNSAVNLINILEKSGYKIELLTYKYTSK